MGSEKETNFLSDFIFKKGEMDRFSILKSSIQQEHSQDFSRGTYNFQDILFKISPPLS